MVSFCMVITRSGLMVLRRFAASKSKAEATWLIMIVIMMRRLGAVL